MKDKLKKLMTHEGINSTRLAEMLGIQPSGISHIMSGRNKPSFDFIVKLLNRFPQINPDWLLSDKGPMYRDEIKNKSSVLAVPATAPSEEIVTTSGQDLFSSDSGRPVQSQGNPQTERDDEDIIPAHTEPGAPKRQPDASAGISDGFTQTSSIERIVVFFKDKTFTEYQPG